MGDVVPLRPSLGSNTVFEAFDQHDDTKQYHFAAYRDEEDMGVYLETIENHVGADGSSKIRDMMWIDADQCEQFGRALLAAAEIIRAQEVG